MTVGDMTNSDDDMLCLHCVYGQNRKAAKAGAFGYTQGTWGYGESTANIISPLKNLRCTTTNSWVFRMKPGQFDRLLALIENHIKRLPTFSPIIVQTSLFSQHLCNLDMCGHRKLDISLPPKSKALFCRTTMCCELAESSDHLRYAFRVT